MAGRDRRVRLQPAGMTGAIGAAIARRRTAHYRPPRRHGAGRWQDVTAIAGRLRRRPRRRRTACRRSRRPAVAPGSFGDPRRAVCGDGRYGCPMPPLSVVFVGAGTGRWRIERLDTVAGTPLAPASHLEVIEGPGAACPAADAAWALRGVTSNERYATAGEHRELAARQAPLGRAGATRAALIPVKKSEAWELAQDERRRIFEESSHHIATGLEYLPAVARRLHHGRDLAQPFDFLTWFEFAPGHAAAFEELVLRLRATEEWTYVEREIDLRLAR